MNQSSVDGRRTRWDTHRRERRDELIDAVIEAVRRRGSQIGMDQIAESAGTSKAVFYRYFTDKADLYRRVGQRLAGILLADIARAVDEQTDDVTMLRAGVDAYLRLLDEDPELYRFVVHNPLLGDAGATAVEDYSAMIAELITAIMGNRLRGHGVTSDALPMWGAAVVGAVRAAGDWWIEHPGGSRARLTDQLVALLWHGMSIGGDGGAPPAGLLVPVP